MSQAIGAAESKGFLDDLNDAIARILSDWDVPSADAEMIAKRVVKAVTSQFAGGTLYFRVRATTPSAPSETYVRVTQFMSALVEAVGYELNLLDELDELEVAEAADEVRSEVASLFAGQIVYVPFDAAGQAMQRARHALDMSRRKLTRSQIAEAFGVSQQAVAKMLKRALAAESGAKR